MPAILHKKAKRSSIKFQPAKQPLSCLCVEDQQIVPIAGMGACRKCSCKKYVPETNRSAASITSHQAYPCANCGHDVKMHA